MIRKCPYCGHNYSPKGEEIRCDECEKQFKRVLEMTIKKFGSSLKRLAER